MAAASAKPHLTRLLLGIAALATVLLSSAAAPWPAAAHGKELSITVTPLMPDPGQPLLRLYRVTVVFAGDLDPVDGATVVLRANRREGGEVGPVGLTEIDDRPGLYVAEVIYDRFGTWQLSLDVTAALGQGDGRAEFTDHITPGALSPQQEAALVAEGERVIRLQLFFAFDWWPDVINVSMRIVHSMAGLAYFVATGLVFGMAWIGVPAGRREQAAQLRRLFFPATMVSLSLLLAAGLYSAAFDAPIVAPGIYDVKRMLEIPYGEWYLAAFLLKPVLFVVLVVMAIRINGALRGWNGDALSAEHREAVGALRRASVLNGVAGLLLVADVAVVIYLHYITHLGVFLPDQ